MPENNPEEKDNNEISWQPEFPAQEGKPNYIAVVIVAVLLFADSALQLPSLFTMESYPGGAINQFDTALFGLLGLFSAIGLLFRLPLAHQAAVFMLVARVLTLVPLFAFILIPWITASLPAEETTLVVNDQMTIAYIELAIYGIFLFVLTRPRVRAVFVGQ